MFFSYLSDPIPDSYLTHTLTHSMPSASDKHRISVNP